MQLNSNYRNQSPSFGTLYVSTNIEKAGAGAVKLLAEAVPVLKEMAKNVTMTIEPRIIINGAYV